MRCQDACFVKTTAVDSGFALASTMGFALVTVDLVSDDMCRLMILQYCSTYVSLNDSTVLCYMTVTVQ